jgi:tRNA A37 threonylcarbamoyladenosine dehydratase
MGNGEYFTRTELLLGTQAMQRLASARVAVFGVGGVGGYAVEALVRSGIGAIDIFDRDTVDVSNINRQLIATVDTVGRPKTEVLEERIRKINPECTVNAYQCFYMPENAEQYDLSVYSYIIDAVDTVTAKLELAVRANALGVPIISAMGAGNKLDPTAFRVADISKTRMCPLAKVMRRELRQRGIYHLKVVYSEEPPRKNSARAAGGKPIPGSIAFVPSVAGLIIAGEVIKDIGQIV